MKQPKDKGGKKINKLRGAQIKNFILYCPNCGETMERLKIGDWKDDLFG